MVSQLFAGIAADRIGPKRTLIVGYVFSVLSALYMAYAVGANIDPTIIVVTYPIFSLMRGISLPAASALVADDRTDLINSFSMMVMASNLGFAIGPAIGGLVVSGTGYASLFLISSALLTAGLFLAFLLKEAKYHLAAKKESVKPDKWVTMFLVLTFLGYVVIGQNIEPFALYAGVFDHVDSETVGYLFTFSGMVIVVFQLVINKILRKYGPFKTLMISSFVSVMGYALTAISGTAILLFLSMRVITLAEIFFVVPSQLWITMKSPSTRKGAYQGYYSAVRNGGRSVAAWMGSTILGLFGFNPLYAWLIIVGCAATYGLGYTIHHVLLKEDE